MSLQRSYRYLVTANDRLWRDLRRPLTFVGESCNVGVVSEFTQGDRIPGVTVKGYMRHFTRQLIDGRMLAAGDEVELFGDESRAGVCRLSDAVVTMPSESGQLGSRTGLRPRRTFKGRLRLYGGGNHVAMAAIVSLSAVAAPGKGLVEILVDGADLRSEVLYERPMFQINRNHRLATSKLLPMIEEKATRFLAHVGDGLTELHPREFERVVAQAFRGEGFRVQLTPETWDGGYDVLAIRKQDLTNNEVVLVECKRWKRRKVGVDVIRKIVGVMAMESATKGVVVTSSSFTKPAITAARRVGLTLLDLRDLKEWIGVVESGDW